MKTIKITGLAIAGAHTNVAQRFSPSGHFNRILSGYKLLSLLLLLVFSFTTQFVSAAEVTTDKSDYLPGSTSFVNGKGFRSGEKVHCKVDAVETGASQKEWEVTANAEGSFETTWTVQSNDSSGTALILTAEGQTSALLAAAPVQQGNPSANLDQGTNGGVGDPPVSPVKWQNGNANQQNSHFTEGDSIPYHLVLENLSLGSHTVEIEWDIRHSDANAIDFITSFGRISETVNPLLNTQGNPIPGGPFVANTFAIPAPPVSSTSGTISNLVQPTTRFNSLSAAEKLFTIYNGTGATLTYINNSDGNLGDLADSNSATRLRITFTATSPTVVFAWGGHIARASDWGDGNSAGGVNGSPYHTRLISLDGSGGNQDRSLSAAAVIDPPTCGVIGDDSVCAGSTNTYSAATDASKATYKWSLTDNTSGASILDPDTESSVEVLAGSAGSYTINVEITLDGRSSTCSQTVRVNALPDCSITGDAGPLCPKSTGNVYTGIAGMSGYEWSISGNGSIPGSTTDQVVSVTAGSGCNAPFTLTLTVTNASGCVSTCQKTVSVQDVTAPVIAALPTVSTIDCPATPSFTQATATDACDASVTLTFVDRSSGTCPVVHVRTWTAADDCGNSSTATQTINVADTTPPVIAALPAVSTIDCPATPSFATATATDACDKSVTLTFSDSSSGTCPVVHVRTWTAADDCGNSSTATQTINVADTTPPVIAALPTVSTIDCPATPSFTQATATDTCDASVTLTFVDRSSGTCPVVHVRTWTAADDCGNSSTATQTINVADTTPPVIAALPTVSTIDCPATPSFTQATATDTCDANVTLTFSDSFSGTCPVVHVRTWTAADDCGNSSTASQTINVADTTPPVIAALPAVSTIDCPATPSFATTTATDACDKSVTLTYVDSFSGTCTVVHVRTWTATDDCGNSSTATQTINVADKTPPVIVCPPDAGAPYPKVPAPATNLVEFKGLGGSASDGCGVVTVKWEGDTAITGSCPSVIVRTYSATDECGLVSTCEQKISLFCPSLVTSSSLCTFDRDETCEDAFNLNFQQRKDSATLMRIVSSNPGQFYYNFFVSGTPGDAVNATATIPYPFVTHGAQPVHVYSDYLVTGTEETGYCLVPGTGLGGFTITTNGGKKSPSGAAIITLGDYTGQASTSTVTVSGGTIPASGTLCVTIHLDFGLKKTAEWTQIAGAAVGSGALAGVTLAPCQEYAFSFAAGVINDKQIVHSVNGFKSTPGLGLSLTTTATLGSQPVQGVKFEAWDATGKIKIGQGFTGADGSGLIPYTHSAKAAEYWIKVPAYQKAAKVTLKANGNAFATFEVP